MIRRLARPMLATVFVIDGVETLRNPQPRVDSAAPLVDKAAPLVEKGEQAVSGRVSASVPPVTKDPETLVKVLAGVKIGAGVTFALGKAPRLSAVALTASHLPTTVSRNDFWSESDPAIKSRKVTGLATDVSLLGALLLASADTAGQPGLAWRARQASDKASAKLPGAKAETAAAGATISGAAHNVADQARGLADTVREKAPEVAESVREGAPEVAETVRARAPEIADQARGQAAGLAESLLAKAPVVAARLRDRTAAAREQAAPLAEQVREQAGPLAAQVREQATPFADQVREQAGPLAAQVREQAAPLATQVRAQAGSAAHAAASQADQARGAAASRAANVDTTRLRRSVGTKATTRTDRARKKLADTIKP